MLREIRCSSFASQVDGKIQNAIIFHSGVNIVCGGDEGDNSIGKTTFLNIIDFAFGGEHYPTVDVKENIGHHRIEFMFEFDGVDYFFSRATQNPGVIAKCNREYNEISELSLNDYRLFLSKQYGLDLTGLSFRDALHCYIRIYSKERPLQLDPIKAQGDKKSKSLERMLKLFGKYGEIAESLNKKNAAEEKKRAYDNAIKYSFVEKISKEQRKKNEKRIEILEQELKKYESENHVEFYDVEATVNEQVYDLRTELAKLKRQRSRIKANLALVDQNQDIVSAKMNEKLADLHEFFPEVNLRKIEEIEKFHGGLKEILSSNIIDARKQLQQKLEDVDKQIEKLVNDLEDSTPKGNVSRVLFHQYARKLQEIERLLAENKNYVTSESIKSDYKSAKQNYTEVFNGVVRPIETSINDKIVSSNVYVCGKNVSAPKFAIQSINRYCYSNEKDEGTGACKRGLLQFHLAVLGLSPLPVLIEDSVNFSDIENAFTLKLLELFSQTHKQVFIALDKVKHYSKDLSIPKIIQDNIVLYLSKGNELFGKAWNVKL
jgi:hypothetical protein